MKRLFVILLGSVCALFYRVFPVDAATTYGSACDTKIQECLSSGKVPHYLGTGTCGALGSSGTADCCNMQIQCETAGTTYTKDNGKSCNLCQAQCATLTGTAKNNCDDYYKTVLNNNGMEPLAEYLCSSYLCCPSGNCSSSGGSGGTVCSKGQYWLLNRCVNCPEHKTTVGSGAKSASECVCDMGYGNDASGTGSGVQCVVCAAGTYKSTAGDTPCTPCPGATGSNPSCTTGATLVTQCYIASGDDSLGSYLYKPNCYYTSGA